PDGQRFVPRLLVAAFGSKNYCGLAEAVRTKYQGGPLTKGENRWTIDGLATAIISPSPWWTDGFVFEAHGRYLVQNTKKVIATSDFYIKNQSIVDVKDLFLNRSKNGDGDNLRWIDLQISQIIIRDVDLQYNPMDRRFIYVSDAVLRIYLI